ncbi:hypothetical protein [Ramlibacter sp.]|uniref:hypothetical protein n=1 Tax=Ramlibacter sp. TaxID=1917967 RepID=UPI0017C11B70|nr:hypothetical protein [Ramlibacter sp.]MBA2673420.1 hypothetical protein [Ramlibacter sp.]
MTLSAPTPQAAKKRPAPDRRCAVSLRLPPEFKALCDRDGMRMAQLIQSFAADLCAIKPLTKITKYVSRGEAAQAAARAYYEAAGFGRKPGDGKERP